MPWNPQTQDRRAELIMQGLQMGQQNAQALGQWLTNFLDEQKKITAAGKSADYFFKANPDALTEWASTQRS